MSKSVGEAAAFFFLGIFICSQIGDHPKEVVGKPTLLPRKIYPNLAINEKIICTNL
jgi:hypothetical protein